MKFLFDEDTGGRIPHALRALGIQAFAIGEKGGRNELPKGINDELWMPIAGRDRFFVFSCNTGILTAAAQRALWIEHSVGGVFLTTGQERTLDVMRLILRRFQWFQEIDETLNRPFAFTMSMHGRPRKVI